jgi:hypothetical protein
VKTPAFPLAVALWCGALVSGLAADAASEASAFFESKVQPVLLKRCYECHSHEKKIKGGLALDSRSGWEHGGDNGPAIQPGKPDQSLLMKAVRYGDPDFAMPPKAKMPAEEIAVLEQWIREGAHDPRVSEKSNQKKGVDLAEGRKFWAFQPIRNPALPVPQDTSWALDPLDRFIRAAQEQKAVQPVGDAPRLTWLRRVSLDLTGLPPSEKEVREFEGDTSPKAFEKVVDRLLGSKSYGERWARHWLDLTGYADMMGTSNGVFAEHAWRYREYVIAAFNADKPFDDFIREQIAGDLLPARSTEERAEKIVATGFLMVGDIEIVNPDKAKMEADHIDAQVAKIGQTFLGMTLGCVRCHDHKFDPIGLEDYYGIAGILRSSPSSSKWPEMGVWSTLNSTVLPETPFQQAERQKLEADIQRQIACLKEERKKLELEKGELLKQLGASSKTTASASGAPSSVRGAPVAAAPGAGESADAKTEQAPKKASDEAGQKEAIKKRSDEVADRLEKLNREINHAEFFQDRTPRAFAMSDGPNVADMPVYVRGNPYATGQVVPRGVLRVASWEAFPSIPAGRSGRLELANWLADRRNPLTARVTVNRLWQKLFGNGIVPSVDYFGVRGDAPTAPELLDHLATRLMDGGWSQKQLLRSLVLSRTYRLGSANEAGAMKMDPENKLLWRMNRQRLDAEALRDSMLSISGELKANSGGPALVLENSENCNGLARKGVNPPNYKHAKPRSGQEFERTVYLPVLRNGLAGSDRLRAVFDFIDPAMTAGQRSQTIVPTQLLFLLNNDLVRKRAQTVAKQILALEGEPAGRMDVLWRRVLGRPVSAPEREDAITFLQNVKRVSPEKSRSDIDAWTELCHSLLASNEFVFRL